MSASTIASGSVPRRKLRIIGAGHIRQEMPDVASLLLQRRNLATCTPPPGEPPRWRALHLSSTRTSYLDLPGHRAGLVLTAVSHRVRRRADALNGFRNPACSIRGKTSAAQLSSI